ncbi:MAG: HTTM domain-containing protein [Deltaproteobacteria bacterium]|nr:HTTM domain-containing protein [Deltaproteobacteria bacterium]
MSRILGAPGRAWLRWVDRIGRRESGEALALFRIGSGAAVVASVLSVVMAGLVRPIWIDAAHGGILPLTGGWLVQALGGATPSVVWGLVVVTLLAGVTLTLGIAGRVSALVAAQGMLALTSLDTDTRCSYDPLLVNSLWLLVLADSTATLSVQCRRRHGRWMDARLVAAWPRYLIIVQLVVLYTATGLHKISLSWTPGGGFSALYYILQQPSWQHGDMTWLAHVYPVTQVGTAVTWIWELTWPLVLLALYVRSTAERGGRARRWFDRLRLRTVYAVIGLGIHLTIPLVMVVGPFSLVTLAYYPCLFRAEELRAMGRGCARRWPWRRGGG